MAVSFFSLNIESDKHLPELEHYLDEHAPDVVALQEVYRLHAHDLAKRYGYDYYFAPNIIFLHEQAEFSPLGEWGIALLSKQPLTSRSLFYYRESGDSIPVRREGLTPHPRSIIAATCVYDGQTYTFATTHFTWAMPDQADQVQAADFTRLQAYLRTYPSFVLSGDFNAPRGSLVWNELSREYITWVPESVESTLDPVLFRKPGLKLVVDHLFSTPDYVCDNVRVLTGLSDHCAIAATISKQN